jgi:hypothetical protein
MVRLQHIDSILSALRENLEEFNISYSNWLSRVLEIEEIVILSNTFTRNNRNSLINYIEDIKFEYGYIDGKQQ